MTTVWTSTSTSGTICSRFSQHSSRHELSARTETNLDHSNRRARSSPRFRGDIVMLDVKSPDDAHREACCLKKSQMTTAASKSRLVYPTCQCVFQVSPPGQVWPPPSIA